MTAPNMAIITALLERSLQNCSLYSNIADDTDAGGGVGFSSSSSSSSDSPENHLSKSHDAILDLNSHLSLPYYWEQCLDLKTGEIYYINWRTGMKAKEDPRTAAVTAAEYWGNFYSEEEDSSCDSEGSSSESSPSSSSRDQQYHHHHHHHHHHHRREDGEKDDHVLVVAGCKSCLMYFMVPKQVGAVCPKCCGQLLHFDRSENGCP